MVTKLNLQLPSLLGQVAGASSGSTKVIWLPAGVKRLKDSMSCGTPDTGQFVIRMWRAWEKWGGGSRVTGVHSRVRKCRECCRGAY